VSDDAPEEARDFLFVQSTTEIGGAEITLVNLLAASDELRRRSVVASLGFGDGDLPARLRAIGAEVVDIPNARLRNPLGVARMVMALNRLARGRRVRVVIGNGTHPQALARVAAGLARVPEVYVVHALHASPLRANDKFSIGVLLAGADLMLGVSQAAVDAVRRLRPRARVERLGNGTRIVDVAPEDARAARAELVGGEDEVLFSVFGRLQYGKGQDVFVEAAGRVAAALPAARFAVIGSPTFASDQPFADGLRARAAELGISSRITFPGYRQDVARLMAGSDVVCQTSRFSESFGLVIVEAMAQGRPVIATRVGGPEEIVQSEQDGLLIEPANVDQLAEAMIRLGKDPTLRARLGGAAARSARERFDMSQVAKNMLRHLSSLL
jgi:glycosyltransferase involved in cell wall biosynthesis